jgi:hypothetical protein
VSVSVSVAVGSSGASVSVVSVSVSVAAAVDVRDETGVLTGVVVRTEIPVACSDAEALLAPEDSCHANIEPPPRRPAPVMNSLLFIQTNRVR